MKHEARARRVTPGLHSTRSNVTACACFQLMRQRPRERRCSFLSRQVSRCASCQGRMNAQRHFPKPLSRSAFAAIDFRHRMDPWCLRSVAATGRASEDESGMVPGMILLREGGRESARHQESRERTFRKEVTKTVREQRLRLRCTLAALPRHRLWRPVQEVAGVVIGRRCRSPGVRLACPANPPLRRGAPHGWSCHQGG